MCKLFAGINVERYNEGECKIFKHFNGLSTIRFQEPDELECKTDRGNNTGPTAAAGYGYSSNRAGGVVEMHGVPAWMCQSRCGHAQARDGGRAAGGRNLDRSSPDDSWFALLTAQSSSAGVASVPAGSRESAAPDRSEATRATAATKSTVNLVAAGWIGNRWQPEAVRRRTEPQRAANGVGSACRARAEQRRERAPSRAPSPDAAKRAKAARLSVQPITTADPCDSCPPSTGPGIPSSHLSPVPRLVLSVPTVQSHTLTEPAPHNPLPDRRRIIV